MSAAFRGQREEVEQMKSCLRVLSQPTPPTAGEAELATDQQEREGALELLADLCENMDNAAGTPPPPQSAHILYGSALSPSLLDQHHLLPASPHGYHSNKGLLAPCQVTVEPVGSATSLLSSEMDYLPSNLLAIYYLSVEDAKGEVWGGVVK